jgi:hypothetical protein
MAGTYQFKPGWSYDADRIADATARMVSKGMKVSFNDARPTLKGRWRTLVQRGVFALLAQDDELKVRGNWRDTNIQFRGTCVEQGSSRGCEDVHTSRLADREIAGKYTLLAGEPAYGYMRNARWSRTHPWGCTCGNCPDGMMGADFAEFAAIHGLIERKVYQDIDLTKPREDLAITWNNTGVPKHIVEAGATHQFIAHQCVSLDDYADAMASKCWGAICLPMIFSGSRKDKNGFCEPDGNGGHCTEVCGVAIAPTGETVFIIQQSWPLSAVRYPQQITLSTGPKKLRPGSYAVRQSVLEGIISQYRNQVELWSYDLPSASSFREAA